MTRILLLLAFLLSSAIAGCSDSGGGDGGEGFDDAGSAPDPAPFLGVVGFTYEDEWCDDDLPVSFTVTASGAGVARNVRVEVTGGYQDAQQTLGDLPAGEARNVALVIRANDNCGSTDLYNVIVTVHSSNSDTQTGVFQVDI